ncbi:methylase of polypeptide subunit release factors [Sinomonas atrocyanea]|uniref:N-6 DNA methylase n=1 Tax=Sinomonas atrocyanea TaxID=37927 RepID=UPI002781E596|nr:N-6 DNA methylase [Sinomonas atrocyanea]MDQ0260485.1 methylase of polypeptide subunit release factors [Sinomonas atrocyanea]
MPETPEDLTARMARRDPARSEATLQADVRAFILAAGLNVDANDIADEVQTVAMEAQLGDGSRRRIDVESGTTVIEVKKNLRAGNVLATAEEQLGQYVQTRCQQTGARYLGVLTDGYEWILYVPDAQAAGGIVQAAEPLLIRGSDDAEKLREWLGAVLATVAQVKPTPQAIEARLGSNSPGHHADHASLKVLLDANRTNPTVTLKRELWAKLLRTAFGSGFEDAEHLFLDHTLLVLTAESIAHAVLGFDLSGPNAVSPQHLADGTRFGHAQIRGVVEADFFDWVLEVDGGEQFVRSLASRVAKFRWDQVEHDVLKHLYESVISQATRESLGEYYTPDWLAYKILADEYPDPLRVKVLDASCGSGTFLFHAVRHYLDAAESSGLGVPEAVDGVVRSVYGMDIHPVAVTLARVTYLLAIGTERLRHPKRGPVSIPVYLGDSLQWEQQTNLLSSEEAITVETTGEDLLSAGGGLLFDDNLAFPKSILYDAQRFDAIVSEMADKVLSSAENELAPSKLMDPRRRAREMKAGPSSKVRDLIDPILIRYDVPEEDREMLRATFSTLRQLHLNGRDHIWGYYVRNLIRPLWLSLPENRVDLLVGNPPWLRYSKMTGSMQDRYKRLARERNLLSGPLGASGRDLSTLFVCRAIELYLKVGGSFAFIMPHGTLTRKPHHGFRTGNWQSNSQTVAGLTAQFREAWELVKIKTGFPMVSCVVFGQKARNGAEALPSATKYLTGKFSNHAQTWDAVQGRVTESAGVVVQHDPNNPLPVSPYAKRFRQGALILPRVLVCVLRTDPGPLGAGAGRTSVISRRSNQDKKPWKFLPSIEASVAEDFIFPLLLGETVLPYRMTEPLECVLPIKNRKLLSGSEVEADPGLDPWWSAAETAWESNRSNPNAGPLRERLDYHGQLSAQLVTESTYRVCYTSSGNRIAAAITKDSRAIVEHKLYWASASTIGEARYLEAILNSEVLLERVKPLQTLGLFGERDFDKYVFQVPFPAWDSASRHHQEIATLAERAENVARGVDLTGAKTFQQARNLIDQALASNGVAVELKRSIEHVIPTVEGESVDDLRDALEESSLVV